MSIVYICDECFDEYLNDTPYEGCECWNDVFNSVEYSDCCETEIISEIWLCSTCKEHC